MDSLDSLPQHEGTPHLRFPNKYDFCKLWTQQFSVSFATAHAYLDICEVKGQSGCFSEEVKGCWARLVLRDSWVAPPPFDIAHA